MDADKTTVTLINLNQIRPRSVFLQAGAYGERRIETTSANRGTVNVGRPLSTVRLEPGCGAQVTLRMSRHVAEPTVTFPWTE